MPVKNVEVRVDSDRGAVARPVAVSVDLRVKDDSVVITNGTGDAIEIWIPNTGARGTRREVGESLTLTPAELAGLGRGRHAYAVYCHEVQDFAKGASSPEIIIRP